MSNSNFTLTAPSISVTSPNGGESWEIGSTHNITWSAPSLTGNVKIEVNGYYPTGAWTVLEASTANDGSYSWTIEGVEGPEKRVRISSVNNSTITDMSNSNFTLTAPSISVTSPNGGESWLIGSTHNITWSAPNLTGNVKIEVNGYYPTGAWTVLESSTTNDGSLTWMIEGVAGPEKRVRITSVNNSSITDMSNSNFTLTAPSISVTSPNGGESWLIGSTHNITWSAPNLTGNVKIEVNGYYPTGAWTVLEASTANDGTFSWTIEGVEGPEKRIRITSVNNSSITDMSNSNFTLTAPSISVTSPNGGESWQIGSKQNITWNSTGITGNVNIEVNGNYPDGKWEPLLMNTSNEGSKSVVITGQEGNAKRIKITSVNNPQISDISDGNFTYKSPLSVVAADDIPLGTRKPLLLIHGWQPEGKPAPPGISIWNNFSKYFDKDQDLLIKFKIYYVGYYSNLISVADLAYNLRLELDRITEFKEKHISIVAHSMGGLVSRAFMNRSVNGIKGGERIDKLITLGTPHHGSPVANGFARNKALGTISNLVSYIDIIDWRTFSSYPEYYEYNRFDLLWDNYDNLFDYNSFPEERNILLDVSGLNRDRTYDGKIITYSGSFDESDKDFPDPKIFKFYKYSDKLMIQMFDNSLSKSVSTDGIVPLSSASFENHAIKNRHVFPGYNHSRLAMGRGIIDYELFGTIKSDLLEDTPISILVSSPSQSTEYGEAVINSSIDKVLSLQNTGSSVISLNKLSIIGTNSDQFKIVSPTITIFNIGIGESQDVTVRFNPTTLGFKTANLQISNNSDNASPIKTIVLSGTGIAKTFNVPTISTTAVSAIDLNGASSGGNNISDGGGAISAKGICWGITANPKISLPNFRTLEGAGTGTFSSRITGLTAGSNYHVRAYATNAAGTAYGLDIPFTTNTNVVIPSVTTNNIFDLKITEASSGGKIISDGGGAVTSRGVCWSSVINPTISNLKTSDGTGIGTFISSISGLTAGSTYHIRAYATNSAGTSYGDDISFTTNTEIIIPTINTLETYNIIDSEVSTGGNIISDGGSTITKRGVCWSTLANPTIELDTKTSDGTGNGVFSSKISGLLFNTVYHIRAYAINSAGTAYGEDISFTSLKEIALEAIFSVNPVSYCTPLTVKFTDESKGNPTTWAWDIDNDGITDYTEANPTHTYKNAGTYSVKLTVTDELSKTSLKTSNVVINAQTLMPEAPKVGIITDPTCILPTGSVILEGLPASWTLTRIPGGTITIGSGPSATISGLIAGTYTYTVTNVSGCTSLASANVVINPFASSPIAPTIGLITHPTCTLTTGSVVLNGLPATATWTLTKSPGGETTTGTGTSKTISGLAAGTYNYSVTNVTGCTSIPSANIIINEQPVTPVPPIVGMVTHSTCALATGSVVLNGLPATGTWTITKSPGGSTTTGSGTSATIPRLATGISTFTVTNASGCTSGLSASVVINTQPTIPAVSLSSAATKILQTGFTANWNSSATASSYRLDVSTNSGFTAFSAGYSDKDAGNVNSFDVTGLNANTSYYYRVRASNLCGASVNSGTITVTTLPTPPAAPTVNSAISIMQTSFNANWSNIATATGYRLDVASDAGFTTFVADLNDKDIGNITSYNVAGLIAHTPYYYRVRAYNSGGTGVSSASITVTTLSNPPATPKGLIAVSCNNLVTLKWRKNADPYFLRYRIYGGMVNNPTVKLDSSSVSISDTSKVISGLSNGQTYYFRVKAVNNDGPESEFSGQSSAIVKTGVIPKIKVKWGTLLIAYNTDSLITNYQWYLGSTLIQNAIGQYYSAGKQAGIYGVETIDKNTCKNFSNTIAVTGVSTKSLTVYPNPASVSFALRLIDTSELKNVSNDYATVSVINSTGQKVLEFKAKNANDELLKAIPVSNLANGVYVVQVLVNQRDLYFTKIVILK